MNTQMSLQMGATLTAAVALIFFVFGAFFLLAGSLWALPFFTLALVAFGVAGYFLGRMRH